MLLGRNAGGPLFSTTETVKARPSAPVASVSGSSSNSASSQSTENGSFRTTVPLPNVEIIIPSRGELPTSSSGKPSVRLGGDEGDAGVDDQGLLSLYMKQALSLSILP